MNILRKMCSQSVLDLKRAFRRKVEEYINFYINALDILLFCKHRMSTSLLKKTRFMGLFMKHLFIY